MITPIIVVSLKLVSPFTVALRLVSRTVFRVLILIDQKMLTDNNFSTCYGYTVTGLRNYSNYRKDFEKTRIRRTESNMKKVSPF